MLVLEGRVFHRGALNRLSLGVEDGRIVRIAKVLEGDVRKDFGDRLLLPAGVDLHVHFRDPGSTDKEDFGTGTAAAGVGGVTTVLDMPNTKPPVTTPEAYAVKLAVARRKANVDFGLYGAIRSPDDVHAFAGRAPAGKVYMAPSAGRLEVTEAETWRGIVAAVAETGTLAAFHAEDSRKWLAEAGKSLPDHHRVRPPEGEVAAIRALGEAARSVSPSPRIHIAHVTSEAALSAVEGTGFTAEVTPHHLFLDSTTPLGSRGKVNPPLRTANDRAALWRGLANGRLDAIASDHAPHTAEEKDAPFPEAPVGVPGVETMLPLVLRSVRRGDMSLERFVDLTAKGPAEIVGLDLGVLEVGRPANLIVVDPRNIGTIRAKRLHSRCGWTPFEGFEAVFPHVTYLRGEAVAEKGEVVAERLGRPLPTPAAKPS